MAQCSVQGPIRQWYEHRRDAFLEKSVGLINEMDVVWRKQIAIFEGVVAQISGPTTTVSLSTIVGRIPPTWQHIQENAQSYLSNTPEEHGPRVRTSSQACSVRIPVP